MTINIREEHYTVEHMLWQFSMVCSGCLKKIRFLKLEVKISGERRAIVCPNCGEPIKTVKANKRNMEESEQELRKALISLVNEMRLKMWAEQEQRNA